MKQEIYDLPVKYAVLELKELGGWLENYNNVSRGFIVSKCYLKKSSIEYFGYGMKEEKYDVIFPFTDFLEFKTSLKKYNYNKLKGKIRECFPTQTEFAQKLGISNTSLSNKLNNEK